MKISKRAKASVVSATVGIADEVQRKRENGESVFDFSAGRAFETTPAYIAEAAINAIRTGDTHQTMAKGKTSYRRAIAEKLLRDHNVIANPETEIIATAGCKQGLTISLLAVLDPGDEVIVEDPCFVSYKETIKYLGCTFKTVPLRAENDFRWDKLELEAAIGPNTKAILICTPHNPTGTVHTETDLQLIAEVCIKHNLVAITDEVYDRVAWGDHKHNSLCTRPGMDERTITLMSFTKSFAMG